MKLILSTLLLISFSTPVLAQKATSKSMKEPIADLSTVAIFGIGGAVLGLSTLPFTDEPSDNLKNILVGGAVGIVIGVGLVAYKQATKPAPVRYQDTYSVKGFTQSSKLAWHNKFQRKEKQKMPSQVGYTFSF